MYRYYIVDDDRAIQRILKNIITKDNLGEVVGMNMDGLDALLEIENLKPDIVLIDLLLPSMDGIKIVKELKKKNINSHFIMISEVSSKDMISKGYQSGIEYFINKPINIIEVKSILNKVEEKIKMNDLINSFKDVIKKMDYLSSPKDNEINEINKDKLKNIFLNLGILSDKGSNDLIKLIEYVYENENNLIDYNMNDLYDYLVRMYEKNNIIIKRSTIEQRIRRTVFKALKNISSIGIDDYSNEVFTRYAYKLFEFEEVRKNMDYILKKSKVKGKVNVKTFIKGIVIELNY
ncbi:MAG: response regulator [Peptostreptococcaceae bacterium]|jgi:two-component system response regulator YcbB|nr:response regulator [Peptostreptococcaceae bacterium]